MWTIGASKYYTNYELTDLTFSSLQALIYFLRNLSAKTMNSTFARAYNDSKYIIIKVNACEDIYDMSLFPSNDLAYLSSLDKATVLEIKKEIKDLECGQ